MHPWLAEWIYGLQLLSDYRQLGHDIPGFCDTHGAHSSLDRDRMAWLLGSDPHVLFTEDNEPKRKQIRLPRPQSGSKLP